MLSYCGDRDNLSVTWMDDGLSPCFYQTLGSSLQLFITFGAFFLQMFIINRYQFENTSRKLASSAYCISEWAMLLVLVVETFVRFAFNWRWVYGSESGVLILSFLARTLVLCITAGMLWISRTRITAIVLGKKQLLPLIFSCLSLFIFELIALTSLRSKLWWFQLRTKYDQVELSLWITRLISESIFLLLIMFSPIPEDDDIEESKRHLLGFKPGKLEEKKEPSAWEEVKHRARVLWTYTWPKGNLRLQVQFVVCMVLLGTGRAVNFFVPIYHKNIVNALVYDRRYHVVLVQLAIFVVLKFLQGGSFRTGVLNGIRSFLWIKIQQHTNRRVQTELLGHLHSLSFRWHLSRKTGEVLRSIDRGMESINTLTLYVFFVILPTIIDIIVAITYFMIYFKIGLGVIVLLCIAVYIVVTILITDWRKKFQRDMNRKDNKAKQRAIDSLLNFETVKYFNAEKYEVKKFDETIVDFQDSQFKADASVECLTAMQSLVINSGLFAGSWLCVKIVLDENYTVGYFVLFVTYMLQLYLPLNFFGTYYQMIQANLIAMEDMFKLFDQKSEVMDTPEAYNLQLENKSLEFDNVNFSYVPERQILKNVSFRVDPGQTVALVGNSGSGKSTIVRLIFRFYDVQSGVIRLGGEDISKLTQSSLRDYIGVVPQDTVLFNDNILNNIRYGRLFADDEEVRDAARAADIHDRITNFPDQYNTVVGERGLKLSGGEKQRVAIARTILKAPDFVLLDEATSALDTTTERNIQASLNQVCAGRTTIVVAHRLSTIKNADCILVLQDGEIVERGSHKDLLDKNGLYADMWMHQLAEIGEEDRESA